MRHPRAWQTQATSPGGTREASPRHKDRGLGPTGRERESGNAAWRVERTRAHASCAPGTRRSGPAREKRAGLAKSRPCAFSARHSPHGEKEKRRANPKPDPKEGGISFGYLTMNRMQARAVLRELGSPGTMAPHGLLFCTGTNGGDARASLQIDPLFAQQRVEEFDRLGRRFGDRLDQRSDVARR